MIEWFVLIDIKRMEKRERYRRFVKMLCDIHMMNRCFHYETDYDRQLKERAFRFIIDEIGYEAINSLISLFNDSNADIRLRAVSCLGEIRKRDARGVSLMNYVKSIRRILGLSIFCKVVIFMFI